MAKFRIKYAGEIVIESDNKINANIKFWDIMDNVDGSMEITDFKVIDDQIKDEKN